MKDDIDGSELTRIAIARHHGIDVPASLAKSMAEERAAIIPLIAPVRAKLTMADQPALFSATIASTAGGAR